MDFQHYIDHQQKKEAAHEALCKRCGACCGVKDGDPCVRLRQAPDGTYFCSIYNERLGMQRTVSGQEIKCVPIREMFSKTWFGKNECGYIESMRITRMDTNNE